jgi:hypothetical protein
MQARKVFDVSALADLAGGQDRAGLSDLDTGPSGYFQEPAFWLAVSGWVAATLMFIALLVANANL